MFRDRRLMKRSIKIILCKDRREHVSHYAYILYPQVIGGNVFNPPITWGYSDNEMIDKIMGI